MGAVKLAIHYKALADLTPYKQNARTHSKEQVAQIADSIKRFGFTNPILLDGESGIIAGHGRLMAAQKMGLAEVPTIELAGLSDADKRAYILADNKLALSAGWDADMLKLEFAELSGLGVDLTITGFSEDEIAKLMGAKMGLTDPDEVPETAPPRTELGDVWQMGRHRLMCGDSTDALAVAKLMNGQSADICFTSPPYSQQRAYKNEISDWDALMGGVFSIVPVKDGAQILVNLGIVHDAGRVSAYWDAWLKFMADNEWPLFGWYVWDKGFGLPGNWNGRLAPAHEFIFHFSKGGNKSANKWVDKKQENIKKKSGTGLRRKDGTMSGVSSPDAGMQPTKVADSVIRVSPHMGGHKVGSHPAMFPVALCDEIYKSYAKMGDWAYEPFSGSGTSIIACEQFGMNCAAMELAPAYVDIAVKRWEDFTGQKAVLNGGT